MQMISGEIAQTSIFHQLLQNSSSNRYRSAGRLLLSASWSILGCSLASSKNSILIIFRNQCGVRAHQRTETSSNASYTSTTPKIYGTLPKRYRFWSKWLSQQRSLPHEKRLGGTLHYRLMGLLRSTKPAMSYFRGSLPS